MLFVWSSIRLLDDIDYFFHLLTFLVNFSYIVLFHHKIGIIDKYKRAFSMLLYLRDLRFPVDLLLTPVYLNDLEQLPVSAAWPKLKFLFPSVRTSLPLIPRSTSSKVDNEMWAMLANHSSFHAWKRISLVSFEVLCESDSQPQCEGESQFSDKSVSCSFLLWQVVPVHLQNFQCCCG